MAIIIQNIDLSKLKKATNNRIPDDLRNAIIQFKTEGYSINSIAAATKVSTASVTSIWKKHTGKGTPTKKADNSVSKGSGVASNNQNVYIAVNNGLSST